MEGRPPNLLLLITDQQRQPRHWPDEPGWVEELMPNDAELARTGLSFENAFCGTAMCSPSRATLLTGRYPVDHGVTLTLTAADLRPDPRNLPAVTGTLADIVRRRQAPLRRTLGAFGRGALRLGESRGNEPELPTDVPGLGSLLRDAGYEVAYKGKWHLTHPLGGGEPLLGGWGSEDPGRIRRDYGFADWEAPDAGENAKAEHFGGGNAAAGEGWDEVYTAQVERWLGRAELPEPFCLVVSLVNPHDVLGYPASYVKGGYSAEEFRDLGVDLPPSVDEDLSAKPAVHSLMRLGMNAYMGALGDRRAKLDYVNFYAHLHRVVDEKIGRILGALGDAGDPSSLRSRTVVVRSADHGEMGLSHGGLRQKAFNAYEETINVPLVISNPGMFPEPRTTTALASLVDVLPTMLALAGVEAPPGLRGHDLRPLIDDPAASVRDSVVFTYDDHQAGTAMTEAPGQPNRVRAIRTETHKYVRYHDPSGAAAPEYELYDLGEDPLEIDNRIGVRSGYMRSTAERPLRDELDERLDAALEAIGAGPPAEAIEQR